MAKVIKTTFVEEQSAKDEAFLKLTPQERWEQMYRIRLTMCKPGVDYSFKGKKVTVKKRS
jgi:hypothetical protein